MTPRKRVSYTLAAAALLLATAGPARAERVRFHYPAADICGPLNRKN